MCQMVIIDDEKWVIKSLLSTIRSQTWFKLAGEAADGVKGLQLLEDVKPGLSWPERPPME
jgi:YesN/AraC family two-component response regulator